MTLLDKMRTAAEPMVGSAKGMIMEGEIPRAWLGSYRDGKLVAAVMCREWNDNKKDKQHAIAEGCLLGMYYDVEGYIFVSDTFISRAKNKEELPHMQPSKDPEASDALVVAYETKKFSAIDTYVYHRGDRGEITWDSPELDRGAKGKHAGLIPGAMNRMLTTALDDFMAQPQPFMEAVVWLLSKGHALVIHEPPKNEDFSADLVNVYLVGDVYGGSR